MTDPGERALGPGGVSKALVLWVLGSWGVPEGRFFNSPYLLTEHSEYT